MYRNFVNLRRIERILGNTDVPKGSVMQCFRIDRVYGLNELFVSWFSLRCSTQKSNLETLRDLKYFIDDSFANKNAFLFTTWNAQFHHLHI